MDESKGEATGIPVLLAPEQGWNWFMLTSGLAGLEMNPTLQPLKPIPTLEGC
jgi:hypothetical protein